jgi:hypothetical protein
MLSAALRSCAHAAAVRQQEEEIALVKATQPGAGDENVRRRQALMFAGFERARNQYRRPGNAQ